MTQLRLGEEPGEVIEMKIDDERKPEKAVLLTYFGWAKMVT